MLFGLIGVIQLAGPKFARQAYERWHYPQRVRLITGALDIGAAALLAVPAMRGWGIGLAGVLAFGSIVILLAHRHYLCASLAIGLMAALVPATLAVPRSGPMPYVIASPTRPESTLMREAAYVPSANTAADVRVD
jgi:hypothetical protein